jgi:glycosyltransferase involved in cell wall biosynthesis
MEHIAIMMAVKNGADIIRAALDSIKNQTAFLNSLCNYTIIVASDAASTDDLASVLKDYEHIDHVYATEPGLVITRNTALFRALQNPEYTHFAVLDCDDAWMLDKIEKQLPVIRSGFDVCGTGLRFVYPDGTTNDCIYPETHDQIERAYLNGLNPLGHSSLLFNRRIFLRCGGYDDTGVAEDYDLFSRAIRYYTFYNVPEALVEYNYDYAIRPQKYKDNIEEAARRVYLKLLANYGLLGKAP